MRSPEYYKRQFGWRAWPRIFDALPDLHGQTVLDLGCGVSDQAAELAARGARVIGVDIGEEILDAARARGLENAEFLSSRLDGMRLLRDFCGAEFEEVREEFLGCLARDDHRSTARVYCCIAAK